MDVYECKSVVEYFKEKYTGKKKLQMFKLLLQKWHILKEFIIILQVPYKATIALQSHRLSLSDAYGIWLKLKIHLQTFCLKKSFKTNLAKFMFDKYNERKKAIFNNPAMVCALYLDPRFRCEIMHNEQMKEQAKQSLLNVWRRINYIRHNESQAEFRSAGNDTAIQSTNNCSGSSDLDMNIDFNDSHLLDNYLSREQTQSEQLENVGESTESASHVHNYDDIETIVDVFDPEKLSSDTDILAYWETMKQSHGELYQLAMVVFSVPPTEVPIERDFSHLEYIFSNRRYNLSPDLLDDILLIHLNSDLFYLVKADELNRLI